MSDATISKKYMKLALKLAKNGEGFVSPNPLVGAVLVKNDKIIGQGYHKNFGGNHAEVNAINMAENSRENIEGSTLYLTLEPCSHFGKTPPCVDLIIENKIKKCIIGMIDPNPLVAGKGIDKLRKNGVEVEVGVLEKECLELNRVFIKYMTTETPYLFLKCAITLDGKIATRNFSSKWITNEKARKKVQILRNRYSAIMVGINTILQDNPSLSCSSKKMNSPTRVVVDPNLKIDLKSKIINCRDDKTILVVSKDLESSEKVKILQEMGIKFIFLEGKRFLIQDILKELGKFKIDSVLLEGGEKLLSLALKENIFDGGEIFIAPKILGDSEALSFIQGFNISKIEDAFEIKNPKFNIYDNNISVEFYR